MEPESEPGFLNGATQWTVQTLNPNMDVTNETKLEIHVNKPTHMQNLMKVKQGRL